MVSNLADIVPREKYGLIEMVKIFLVFFEKPGISGARILIEGLMPMK